MCYREAKVKPPLWVHLKTDPCPATPITLRCFSGKALEKEDEAGAFIGKDGFHGTLDCY